MLALLLQPLLLAAMLFAVPFQQSFVVQHQQRQDELQEQPHHHHQSPVHHQSLLAYCPLVLALALAYQILLFLQHLANFCAAVLGCQHDLALLVLLLHAAVPLSGSLQAPVEQQ